MLGVQGARMPNGSLIRILLFLNQTIDRSDGCILNPLQVIHGGGPYFHLILQ